MEEGGRIGWREGGRREGGREGGKRGETVLGSHLASSLIQNLSFGS